jgi:hypothetical protein
MKRWCVLRRRRRNGAFTGSGASWVAGTRYLGAQVGLPVCFVNLEPWFVVLSGAELGNTVVVLDDDGVRGA